MKNRLFIFITLLGFTSFAQYTSIPDQNYEKELIRVGHDSGEIDGNYGELMDTKIEKDATTEPSNGCTY